MNLDTSKVDLTNQNQKIFAGVIIVIVLALAYYLLPPFIVILKNLWIAAILSLPIIWIICNPMLVWNISKQISWNITKGLIGRDKLGYMWRYHEYLLMKIARLDDNIKNIGAVKSKLQRKISDLKKAIDDNHNKSESFAKQKAPDTIMRTIAKKIALDTQLLDVLLPKFVTVENQEKYLIDLYQNWSADTEDLKNTLESKADEYNTLKELSEAAGNASEFLKGSTDEYKLYQESLRQLEVSVTQYTSNIENFERKVKPILENMALEKAVNEDEGLRLIEEYKKNKISLKSE